MVMVRVTKPSCLSEYRPRLYWHDRTDHLRRSTPIDIVEIQANIDDMSAELLSPLVERLLRRALDVTLTPILMEKVARVTCVQPFQQKPA